MFLTAEVYCSSRICDLVEVCVTRYGDLIAISFTPSYHSLGHNPKSFTNLQLSIYTDILYNIQIKFRKLHLPESLVNPITTQYYQKSLNNLCNLGFGFGYVYCDHWN